MQALFCTWLLLVGLVYASVWGIFFLWWVYAGFVARLMFVQGFWVALQLALLAAGTAAILLENLPGQSMGLGIFKIALWHALAAQGLAWVLQKKRSSVWVLGSSLVLVMVVGWVARPTGLMQAAGWQYFASSFAHDHHPLFQSLLGWFEKGDFADWMVHSWLPLNALLLLGTVMLAWYSLPPAQRIWNWGWSLPELVGLWAVILVPKWITVPLAVEGATKLALAIVVAVGVITFLNGHLKKCLREFVRHGHIYGWAVLIAFWQSAAWVFAGFGSLVLWREGFSDGSHTT